MYLTPEQLKAIRSDLKLTARQAAESVHVSTRTWQAYEAPYGTASRRSIPENKLELFCRKHQLSFPPTRLDGTTHTQNAKTLALLGATGGSGRTKVAIEVGRILAKTGKRVAIVTDAHYLTQSRCAFDNPSIHCDLDVLMTPYEIRDLRHQLVKAGVYEHEGNVTNDEFLALIYGSTIERLERKEATKCTLASLRTTNDYLLLDIGRNAELARLVSDISVVFFDLDRPFMLNATQRTFGELLKKSPLEKDGPPLVALLMNKDSSHVQEKLGNYEGIWSLGMDVLFTSLSMSYKREHDRLEHELAKKEIKEQKHTAIIDAAPSSAAAFEYETLVRELLTKLNCTNSDLN